MADILDGMFAAEAPVEPEVEAAPVETPVEPQVVPEATPEPEPALTPTPEPEAPQDERHVPLGKFLDQRDELREYKRKVAEFEARQQQPQGAPDPFDDPQAFAQHQQQLVQQAIVADRFERSNEDAVEKWGEDKVREAVEWAGERAKANPAFAAEYMGKTRPIHWIVQQHERESDLQKLGGMSLDDYIQAEIAKRSASLPSAAPAAAPVAAVATPAPRPAAPPRSIASDATPASTATTTNGNALWESIFQGR
jgi:hypothetical protein